MSNTPQQTSIAVGAIEPSPFNRKVINDEFLKELTASIKANGVLQAVIVRPSPNSDGAILHGRYQLVIGEHRWRAAIKAGLTTIPCTVVEVTDADAVVMQHAEMLKKQHNALEIGESYGHLSKLGFKPEEIARLVGKSPAHVYAHLSLNKASDVIRTAVSQGKISGSHAARLVTVQQENLVDRIAEENWSMRDLETFLKQQAAREKERAKHKPKPPAKAKPAKPGKMSLHDRAARESIWRHAIARVLLGKVKWPSQKDFADLIAQQYLSKGERKEFGVKKFGQEVILALVRDELSGWAKPTQILKLAKRYKVNVKKIQREVAKKPKGKKPA